MLPPFPPEIISLILHYLLLPAPSPSPSRSPSHSCSPPFIHRRTEFQTDFLFSLNSLNDAPNWAKPAGDRLWKDLHVGVRMEANSIILALKQDQNRLGGAKRGTAGKVKVLHLEIRQYQREVAWGPPGSSPPSSPILTMPREEPEQPDGVTPSQIRQLAELLPNLSTICIRSSVTGSWFFDQDIHEALKSFVSRKGFKHIEFDSHFIGISNILSLTSHAPHLETLKLQSLKHTSNSPDYERIVSGGTHVNLFASLRNLTLSRCYLNDEQFELIFLTLTSRPSTITSLTLHELLAPSKESDHFPNPFWYTPRATQTISRIIPYLESFHLVLAPHSIPLDAATFAPWFSGSKLKKITLGGDNLSFHDNFFPTLLKLNKFRPVSIRLFPTSTTGGLDFVKLGKILQDVWADELVLLDLEHAVESKESRLSVEGACERGNGVSGGKRFLEERVERVNRVRRQEEGKRELILRI
ncbi:hypothetical protein JCM5353_001570 [Sporobolomyces roseus]